MPVWAAAGVVGFLPAIPLNVSFFKEQGERREAVGAAVGVAVGSAVGSAVGVAVGSTVGVAVGSGVGVSSGAAMVKVVFSPSPSRARYKSLTDVPEDEGYFTEPVTAVTL